MKRGGYIVRIETLTYAVFWNHMLHGFRVRARIILHIFGLPCDTL